MVSFFKDVFLNDQFWAVYIGAVAGHIFSLNKKNFEGTRPFFMRIFPNKKQRLYHRIDFLLAPLVGALLVFLFLTPDNYKMSVYVGITWSTTLMVLTELKGEDIK